MSRFDRSNSGISVTREYVFSLDGTNRVLIGPHYGLQMHSGIRTDYGVSFLDHEIYSRRKREEITGKYLHNVSDFDGMSEDERP